MYTQAGQLARINPDAPKRILVFGDIHGDLEPVQKGISLRRPDDLLIFLGDYADRGPEGIEVIEGILELMERIPDKIIALMGNHEEYDTQGRPSFSPCTLIDEAEYKRGGWFSFFPTFRRFAERLSLAALLPGFALFAHGGIGSELSSEEALISPTEQQRRQILWGDPSETAGEAPSFRGAGRTFGPDISLKVLGQLGVRHFIRSHEPRKAFSAPAFEHDGRIITTSSTRVYGGRPFALVLDMENLPENQKAFLDSVHYLD